MNKVDYVLRLSLGEIKYDVNFDSWRKSKALTHSQRLQSPTSEPLPIAMDDDDELEDWLHRQIENAIADIEAELVFCLHPCGQPKAQTDELGEMPQQWHIHLQMPFGWRGSARAMNNYAHRYVVNKVLYRWYLASDLRQQAADMLDEANKELEALYLMCRVSKVELKPWRL